MLDHFFRLCNEHVLKRRVYYSVPRIGGKFEQKTDNFTGFIIKVSTARVDVLNGEADTFFFLASPMRMLCVWCLV